jgi:hypothetical protein
MSLNRIRAAVLALACAAPLAALAQAPAAQPNAPLPDWCKSKWGPDDEIGRRTAHPGAGSGRDKLVKTARSTGSPPRPTRRRRPLGPAAGRS